MSSFLNNIIQEDEWFMKICLEKTEIADKNGEVPVAALVVDEKKQIIASAINEKEKNNDPCAHAEMIILKKAGAYKESWRLNACTLYVSLEPCLMCLSAMIHARIERLVFGTYDFKAGAISLGYNLQLDSRLNHHFEITGGVLHFENSSNLSNFFKRKRKTSRLKI